MKYSEKLPRKIFIVFNYLFLTLASILCILPFVNLLATSFSSSTAVAAGDVGFLPVDFSLKSYQFVMKSNLFLRAMFVSIERVVLGLIVNMFLTILTSYALSKEKKAFRWRGVYAWYFIITILFNGGLIPWYMVISKTGLIDSIWALILPGALPVFNMIVLLNFFRGLPKELEEASFIDGANHWTVLWRVFIPISKPALATVSLFCLVNHWNSWFDGMILMNKSEHYPLQSYLQTVIMNPDQFMKAVGNDYTSLLSFVNSRTTKAAQLFLATIPILAIYPFLQKYFTNGLVLGSVKG